MSSARQLLVTSLDDLPKEILVHIFSFVKWKTAIRRFSRVCLTFGAIISSDTAFYKVICGVYLPKGGIDQNTQFRKYENSTRRKKKNWNTWKFIFVKYFQTMGWKRFVKKLQKGIDKTLEDEVKVVKIRNFIKNPVSVFCSLSCIDCREMGIPYYCGGDFEMVCNFFPKRMPKREELLEHGVGRFQRKNEKSEFPAGEMDPFLYETISEEFKRALGKVKGDERKEVSTVQNFSRRYQRYVDLHGLCFNYPSQGECGFNQNQKKRGPFRPRDWRVTNEQVDEFLSSEIRIKNFLDFGVVCCVDIIKWSRQRVIDRETPLKPFWKKKPSWTDVLNTFGRHFNEETARYFLPMYSEKVINVVQLRGAGSGNDNQIIVEGKNGYYFLRTYYS